MREVHLSMDISLGIRLVSVNFSNEETASVIFELSSTGRRTVGHSRQPLVTIAQESPAYRDDNNLPDYNRIVETAARKLQDDFEKVNSTLSRIYQSTKNDD